MTLSIKERIRVLRHVRIASLIFIILFALIFWAGLSTGRYENSDTPNKPNDQLLNFGLTAVLPLGVSFFVWFLSGEINDAVQNEKKLFQEQYNQKSKILEKEFAASKLRYERLSDLYFTNEGSKLRKILESDIPQSTKDELVEISQKLEKFEAFFTDKDEAAKKLVRWLSKQENRVLLGDKIYYLAVVSYDLPLNEEVTLQFRQDLGKCILWLRDSIRILQDKRVTKERLAKAAIMGLPHGFAPYERAIRSIMLEPQLLSLSKHSNVLDDYTQQLIAKLRKEIQAT